ncbi:MAG: SDR family oxidoreductase [Gemmatimonadaceae bacterium]|nr:SDR family oxidoreductase [Chitinophagaceae bacterium]
MFRLDDKIAVVTGAGSGIGRAVACAFAKQGALVHVLDLSEESANQTIELIAELDGNAKAHVVDVSDQSAIREVFASIGKLDILVNNAGIAHIGNVETTGEEDFQRIFNINVKGVYNCMNAAVPMLKSNGGGVITNLSSIAALVGITDRFAYSMSKGAVHAMSLSVARDYLSSGIRCNTVSPARVHTPFVDGFIAKNYPGREQEIFEKLSKSQPIGRMGTVDEVAALILFLSSSEAAFITGCDYPVDGGFLNLNN